VDALLLRAEAISDRRQRGGRRLDARPAEKRPGCLRRSFFLPAPIACFRALTMPPRSFASRSKPIRRTPSLN
jgi:hypothetical protein